MFDNLKKLLSGDYELVQKSPEGMPTQPVVGNEEFRPWGGGILQKVCNGVGGAPVRLTTRAMEAIMQGEAPFILEVQNEGGKALATWQYDAIRFSRSDGKVYFIYLNEDVAYLEVPDWYGDLTVGCIKGISDLQIT